MDLSLIQRFTKALRKTQNKSEVIYLYSYIVGIKEDRSNGKL